MRKLQRTHWHNKSKLKENVQKAAFDVNANYEKYLAAQEAEKVQDWLWILHRKVMMQGKLQFMI